MYSQVGKAVKEYWDLFQHGAIDKACTMFAELPQVTPLNNSYVNAHHSVQLDIVLTCMKRS
jgi:hypothetical protein